MSTGRPDVVGFRELLARRFGLHWEDAKDGFLAEILDSRSKANGESATAYLARLAAERSPDELDALAQELTVGETYFFRNIAQFHALAQIAIPELVGRSSGRGLRVLSAGCSSGEEPYSIAIVLREVVPALAASMSIRAVDINPRVLARAAEARYTSWSLRETPPHQQRAWFRTEGRDVRLGERVREMVTFEHRNLAGDDPELWQPGAYDIVFCRNVLMYFTADTMRRVVDRIEKSLAPGGYLFLGSAETLRGASQAFELRHTHGTFYYQLARGLAGPADAGDNEPIEERLAPATLAASDWVSAIDHAAQRIRALSDGERPARRGSVARGWDLGQVLELLRSERFVAALELVERLPPQAAEDPEVMLVKSALLAHSGEFTAAMEACMQLLAVDLRNAGAHYVLALCREHAGDARGAADHDRTAAHLDPGFAMPRLHLGLLARRAGDHDAARRELGQAVHLLERETAARLVLFGGGFERAMLIALCREELGATR